MNDASRATAPIASSGWNGAPSLRATITSSGTSSARGLERSAARSAGRCRVVVHVRDRVVIPLLVGFAAILVRMHEGGVIVLVLVVVGTVCELAHRTTGVLVRHVPVIVAMDLRRVTVLMRLIADNFLFRVDRHCAPPSAPKVSSRRRASTGNAACMRTLAESVVLRRSAHGMFL